MTRTSFKKTVKTTFCGKCVRGGNTWTDRVRSTKSANKAFRKVVTD